MKLAIVGSVTIGDSRLAAAIIEYVIAKYKPAVVVSGGARGADTLAAKIAKSHGIKVDEKLPAVDNWQYGYKPRNILIARGCDRLVRIAARAGKTYGSGWTRDYAQSIGKPTEEYVIPCKKDY